MCSNHCLGSATWRTKHVLHLSSWTHLARAIWAETILAMPCCRYTVSKQCFRSFTLFSMQRLHKKRFAALACLMHWTKTRMVESRFASLLQSSKARKKQKNDNTQTWLPQDLYRRLRRSTFLRTRSVTLGPACRISTTGNQACLLWPIWSFCLFSSAFLVCLVKAWHVMSIASLYLVWRRQNSTRYI